MASKVEIKVPDIGDFADVEVIEILVSEGDPVDVEQPLITLESDKASIDVPSPQAGLVEKIAVSIGDRVSEGSLIAIVSAEAAHTPGAAADADTTPPNGEAESFFDVGGDGASEKASTSKNDQLPQPAAAVGQQLEEHYDVIVIGAGPGGYTAAFRAADLGCKTLLVEREPTLGGVCLNVGCIPSKALLHTAKVITEARDMAAHGVRFGAPEIDLTALGEYKNGVVTQLTKGLAGLARQRKVEVAQATAQFSSSHTLLLDSDGAQREVSFEHAIIAVGSEPTQLPFIPEDPRIWDSTAALELRQIPDRLLIMGGGIIGLEMASVYSALGSKITIVELLDGLMPGADRDLVRPFQKFVERDYEAIYLGTKVTAISPSDSHLTVSLEGNKSPESADFDAVIVSVGRVPNGAKLSADKAGVAVDERGFIAVDDQQRTNISHIFAIGDVTGQPMLAHKATHEGKVAAEVCAGHKSGFDARCIPSVAYTDPEVAWVGLTEEAAKQQEIGFEKGVFPWAASGRSLGMGRNEGITKLLFCAQSGRLLGAGIVGPHAGDLIGEAALAIEMGADAADLALTIHPHPTLSETINFAAEVAEGTITDLYLPKRKSRG